MKKVSIVVPTYNQAEYLPITLDHVLLQDYNNLEVIVVNGGSTDNTREVLDEYMAKTIHEETDAADRYDGKKVLRVRSRRFPREREIHVRHFEENIGVSETYNVGMRMATGEYATYVVSDDIPYLNMVSRLVAELESTGVDFVYADTAVVEDRGRILKILRKPDYSFERCFADWFHLSVARLYKRLWHERVGYFDSAYRNANDYDMYLRMAMAGCTFRHVPEVLYAIRAHEPYRPTNQHTPDRHANLFRESILCAERARAFLRERRKGNA